MGKNNIRGENWTERGGGIKDMVITNAITKLFKMIVLKLLWSLKLWNM
jgi:hypothetical protein